MPLFLVGEEYIFMEDNNITLQQQVVKFARCFKKCTRLHFSGRQVAVGHNSNLHNFHSRKHVSSGYCAEGRASCATVLN